MKTIKIEVPSIVVEGYEIDFSYSVNEEGDKQVVYWTAEWRGGERYKNNLNDAYCNGMGKTPKTAFKNCMANIYDFLMKWRDGKFDS